MVNFKNLSTESFKKTFFRSIYLQNSCKKSCYSKIYQQISENSKKIGKHFNILPFYEKFVSKSRNLPLSTQTPHVVKPLPFKKKSFILTLIAELEELISSQCE